MDAKSVDPKCLTLAEHFLPDGDLRRQQLAEDIQKAVETWFYIEELKREHELQEQAEEERRHLENELMGGHYQEHPHG